jgi:hypothetical protein
MNWDAIGAIAELLGAIGVIASLVYLATQIRQSREQMSQNTRHAGNPGCQFPAMGRFSSGDGDRGREPHPWGGQSRASGSC